MRTIRRSIVASVLALPLSFGAMGIASATEQVNTGSGAQVQGVGGGQQGAVNYHGQYAVAGPEGVAQYYVNSGTTGFGGGAYYGAGFSAAGPEGAATGNINASTGGQQMTGQQSGGLLSGLGL
ncbi:hypothetical protein B0I33_10947 [Prauserella shujinwangii]|uniref:Uncharacterized protein n=1 Tax=Prauserella shujinwangii TaxID=1453103 RepID=A0A2T0LPY3_9PSEU|nr:hypothetical protein [Prauserella shujinwangii]PRX45384.1 hypothetical protein B0I33_10947 [Prauserella shujinwangii]